MSSCITTMGRSSTLFRILVWREYGNVAFVPSKCVYFWYIYIQLDGWLDWIKMCARLARVVNCFKCLKLFGSQNYYATACVTDWTDNVLWNVFFLIVHSKHWRWLRICQNDVSICSCYSTRKKKTHTNTDWLLMWSNNNTNYEPAHMKCVRKRTGPVPALPKLYPKLYESEGEKKTHRKYAGRQCRIHSMNNTRELTIICITNNKYNVQQRQNTHTYSMTRWLEDE